MTTEIVNVQIREDGSRVVARNLRDVGRAAEEAASPLDQLKGLLAGLVTAAAVAQVARLADEYTNLQNRLRLVTSGTENLARVTKELQGIANATRSDFTSTAELYARLASTTKDLGLSQRQVLNFTKSLNQAIVLSGASAQEAAGGLRQLAQGLASGTLRGDELNSVMENFPKVAQIIAEGMGKSLGEVRKLGAEGQITAQVIIDAFAKASTQLDQDFGTTVPTLSQSFTVLRNNITIFIGKLNESTGATAALSRLILLVSDNLNVIIPLLAAVGIAAGIAFSIGPLVAFAGALQKLFWLVAANPFTALAAVIGTVTLAIFFMRDQIKLGVDETTTLGDLMRATWEGLGEFASQVGSMIGVVFKWITGESETSYGKMTKHAETHAKQTEAWWLKGLRIAAQVFDMIGGIIRGVFAGLSAIIGSYIEAWMNNFKQLGNAIQGALEMDGGKIMAAVESSNAGWEDAGKNAAELFWSTFGAEQLRQQDNGVEALLNATIKRAQEISAGRVGKEGDLDTGGPPPPPPPGGDAKTAKRELDRLRGSLESLLDQTDPVGAAMRQLAEAQRTLTGAVKQGWLTQEQAAAVYAEVEFQLRDALDPLAAYNRELDEHARLLRLSSEQAQVEERVISATQQLRQQGITLTQQETDALRAKLTVEQELTRIAQQRDQLESESQGRRARDLSERVGAAGQLVDEGRISRGDAVSSLARDIPGLSQTQDFLTAQREQYDMYYAAIDDLRQRDLISETGAAQAKMAIFKEQYAAQFQAASDALGNLASLQRSENKKMAAVGKAAAIAQALINTYQSATGAYSAMAGIPVIGPVLGAAAAAAAVAAGLANVSAIRGQSTAFRTGGNLTVGGSGGTDSQLVQFRATPGERVQVNTPAQARALERLGDEPRRGGPESVTMNLTVVQQGRADRTTPFQTARQARRELAKEFNRS